MPTRDKEILINTRRLERAVTGIVAAQADLEGDNDFARRYSADTILAGLTAWLESRIDYLLDNPASNINTDPDFREAIEVAADEQARDWCKSSRVVVGKIAANKGQFSDMPEIKTVRADPGYYGFQLDRQAYNCVLNRELTAQGLSLNEAVRNLKRAILDNAVNVTRLGH